MLASYHFILFVVTPPPSTIPRPQFTSDLFSPLPDDSTQPQKVSAAVGPTVKGHRSDASPLLVASSWTVGVAEPQVTTTTFTIATGSTTSVASSQDFSSVSLHSSTEERYADCVIMCLVQCVQGDCNSYVSRTAITTINGLCYNTGSSRTDNSSRRN